MIFQTIQHLIQLKINSERCIDKNTKLCGLMEKNGLNYKQCNFTIYVRTQKNKLMREESIKHI